MSNDIQNEMMARRFHEAYRSALPQFDYPPVSETAIPWFQTAARYRRFLAFTLAGVLAPLYARIQALESNLSTVQDELDEAKDVIRYGGTWTPNKDE
jgi:hypothetical protein